MAHAFVAAALAVVLSIPAVAAEPTRPPGEAILLTTFLRHHQSRPLGEIDAQLTRNGWYEKFPPARIEVVSWYVVMGIGQVVTLRVPPRPDPGREPGDRESRVGCLEEARGADSREAGAT